jgi:hypothetical protein
VIVARIPLFVTEARRSATQFVLQWTGGSGLYQLQQRTNLSVGSWENEGGPTTALGFTNDLLLGSVFYRVQSLSN